MGNPLYSFDVTIDGIEKQWIIDAEVSDVGSVNGYGSEEGSIFWREILA